MKRPSFFFNRDCGCYGRSQTGDDCASFPVVGALITDNRYFSLAVLPSLKLLGVGAGSNTQAFLKPTVRGFLMVDTAGTASVTNEPALTLPVLNPAVSSVHPVPASFKYLVIANGSDPANWQFVAAPTTGNYLVKSLNGSFVFSDVGEIPGIQEVGTDAVFTAKGDLMTLVKVTDDDDNVSYVVRKLQVVDTRVVVGDVDDDGNGGFKTLPASDFLTHPKAKFTTFQMRTVETLDADGAPISGGLEQPVGYGVGAITDMVTVGYSPSQKRIYKALPHTRSFTSVSTATSSTAAPSSYAALPGGHGVSPSLAIHYPNVRISGNIGFTADEAVNIALYRDGVLLHEFTFQSSDNPVMDYLDVGVTPGTHTYAFYWRKDVGSTSPAAVVRYSNVIVTTLP